MLQGNRGVIISRDAASIVLNLDEVESLVLESNI